MAAVLGLASAGGSPGVTTTALALALNWTRAVMVAECDPAGGSVLPGLWRGHDTSGASGLPLRIALAAQRDPGAAAGALHGEALALASQADARLLPAGPGPETGRQMAGAWSALTAAFTITERDVIADIGRFDADGTLDPLLAGAALVLLVCRPTLRQAAAAVPRLKAMRDVRPADGLVVIGRGEYSPKVLARQLGVPVAGTLPADPGAASVLSDGTAPGRGFTRSDLMQAARGLARRLAAELAPAPVLPAGVRR